MGGTKIVELVGVSRIFNSKERTASVNVNPTIVEGEFLAIVVPSGTGKSTILNILGLLDLSHY